ncbi:hypothetical protein ABIE18_003340 [Arthrobacter sp. 2762]
METPSSTLPARRSDRRNASRALAANIAGLASVGHGSGQDEAPHHKSGNRAGAQFGIEEHGMEQLEIELFNRAEPHAPAAIQQLDNQRVGTAWTSKWTNYLHSGTPGGIRRQTSSKPTNPKQTTPTRSTFSQTTLRQTPLRQTTLRRTPLMGSEGGMATAEYAIATLAAVGLAGLLVVILRSEEVRGFLLNLVRTALSLP